MISPDNSVEILYEELDKFKKLKEKFEKKGINFFHDYLKKHSDIVNSLNPKLKLREYQFEAIGRFIYYCEEYPDRRPPLHILFNMATGSGKTLIMAATILYLYKKGYRNFIFFTCLKNIVNKTKDNFINFKSSKYLFAEEVNLDGSKVLIQEVQGFNNSSKQDINIMFTTINGLHTQWQNPKENSLSPEDLKERRIVLLGDEAHHFSVNTKKLGKTKTEENNSWENTILANLNDDMGHNYPGLLKINNRNENILLEFTATLDWKDINIIEKYKDKVLFRYELAKFRQDGFSKNVSTLQFAAPYFERALAALILSQYRLKVSQEYKVLPEHIKPVVLFKSNRINKTEIKNNTEEDNPRRVGSNDFKEMFHRKLAKITVSDIENIKRIAKKSAGEDGSQGSINISEAFDFFEKLDIGLDGLVKELKRDFAIEHCFSVDNNPDTSDKEILLNSLEDESNSIRVIFATESLNEGWDVLNLFDIVRLYDTRDSIGNSTIKEAQLIGRGARYCPFVIKEKQDLYRRKFDDELSNPLSILERLHYHSTSNSRYIQELEQALINLGIQEGDGEDRVVIEPKDDIPPVIQKFDVQNEKQRFTKTRWQDISIYLNDREEQSPPDIIDTLETIANKYLEKDIIIRIPKHEMREKVLKDESEDKGEDPEVNSFRKINIQLLDLGIHVVRAAIDSNPTSKLSNLIKICTSITSITDFISDLNKAVGKHIALDLQGKEMADINQEEKLIIARKFIGVAMDILVEERKEHEGTKDLVEKKLGEIFDRKKEKKLRKKHSTDNADDAQIKRLVANDWFAQKTFPDATDQEVAFLEFIDGKIDEINKYYDYFMVFRNDNHFSIYNFDDGAKFNPDFLLVLKSKNSQRIISHQVFAEPKGPRVLDSNNKFENGGDGWKQNLSIEFETQTNKLEIQDPNINIFGLPFFHKKFANQKGNSNLIKLFEKEFDNKLFNRPIMVSKDKKK